MTVSSSAAGPPEDDGFLLEFDRDRPSLYEIERYVSIQRAIMPVIGWTSDSIEPLGTCFCVCQDPTVLLTAWHVVDRWLQEHSRAVVRGAAYVAALWETDEQLGDGSDLGGPLPAWRVLHEQNSELAFVLPFDQQSGDRRIVPSSIAPIGFGVPDVGDWCYSLGFPTLRASGVVSVDGRRGVDLVRKMSRAAGRVVESFPAGQPGHAMVPGPAFQVNMPSPHGLSGGPVLTDRRAICGLVSSALDPNEYHPEWTTYVTLLAAGLDVAVIPQENGKCLSLRDLADADVVSAQHPLPLPRRNVGTVDVVETGYPLGS